MNASTLGKPSTGVASAITSAMNSTGVDSSASDIEERACKLARMEGPASSSPLSSASATASAGAEGGGAGVGGVVMGEAATTGLAAHVVTLASAMSTATAVPDAADVNPLSAVDVKAQDSTNEIDNQQDEVSGGTNRAKQTDGVECDSSLREVCRTRDTTYFKAPIPPVLLNE